MFKDDDVTGKDNLDNNESVEDSEKVDALILEIGHHKSGLIITKT